MTAVCRQTLLLVLILGFNPLNLFGSDAVRTGEPFVAGFDRFGQHAEIDEVLAGRLLLSELSCTACHAADHVSSKSGPSLKAAGSTLQASWVQSYLLQPDAKRPGTTMPHVLKSLPENQRSAAAKALTAYLMNQRREFPEIKATGVNPVPFEFWRRGDVERGKQLFHQVGCVACHAPDEDYEVANVKPSPIEEMLQQLEPDEIAELGLAAAARRVNSVPQPLLSQKYSAQSLTHFLLNPEATRPSGRMPNLKLSAMDAAHVTAWLMHRDAAKHEQPVTATDDLSSPELIAEGRQLFQNLSCHNCHDIGDRPAAKLATPLAKSSFAAAASCVGSPEVGLPHYEISDIQQAALRAAIAELQDSPSEQLPEAERLQLTLLQLNCYACHERERLGGVGRFRSAYFETVENIDIGDEGRLPPQLTSVGRKLKVEWMKSVLDGKATVRPHMHIRMPEFPKAQVGSLAQAFASIDHPEPHPSEQQVFGDLKGLAEDGRILMDVGCVQCHAFRGETLPGSVGVDLEGVAGRIHPEWFREFLENPGALKRGTRMPTFFPNGKSQVTDLQNGDMHRQIAAMWAYTKDISNQPLPGQIAQVRSHNFELDPQQRPLILRTFMPVAGTHAIAVGFPQHVHIAFDAEHVRFAEAWRGRFLDAEGTWFSRFTPPAEPLSESTMRLPDGVPLVVSSSADDAATPADSRTSWPANAEQAGYRFKGYRLNADGVPVFLYRISGVDVQDWMVPDTQANSDQQRGLVRHLVLTQNADAASTRVRFLAHAGKQLKSLAPNSMTDAAGLQVTLEANVSATLVERKDRSEWILDLPADSETTIKVRYSW